MALNFIFFRIISHIIQVDAEISRTWGSFLTGFLASVALLNGTSPKRDHFISKETDVRRAQDECERLRDVEAEVRKLQSECERLRVVEVESRRLSSTGASAIKREILFGE